MRVPTGYRLDPSGLSPVFYPLLQLPSPVATIEANSLRVRDMALAGKQITGRFSPLLPDRDKDLLGQPGIVRWLTETPILLDWVHSDAFLRAPSDFPDAVRNQMGDITPFELAASWPVLPPHSTLLRSHLVADLLAYCHGVDVDLLSHIYGLSPAEIVNRMVRAVQVLWADPGFTIWGSNRDLNHAPMEFGGDRPMFERMEAVASVQRHPLALGQLRWLKDHPLLYEALTSGRLPERRGPRLLNEKVWIYPPRD